MNWKNSGLSDDFIKWYDIWIEDTFLLIHRNTHILLSSLCVLRNHFPAYEITLAQKARAISTMRFPWCLSGEESTCSAGASGDVGLMPELGRSPGGGHGTHSSILAWRVPGTEEPGRLQPNGVKKSETWLMLLSKHTWKKINEMQRK